MDHSKANLKILHDNRPRRVCWKCGLADGEPDLAGCTMDVLAAHDLVDPLSRPYRDVPYEEVTARYLRCRVKARSAMIEAEHLEHCKGPGGGPDGTATELYRQKTMKRARVAGMLWREVVARVNEATADLLTEMEASDPE